MRIPLSALIGLVLTGTFLFVAIFAHWIARYPISDSSGGQWEGMSATHWLGTDTIGRDILSRLIYGAQITIFVALASSVLSFSLGAFLGFLAAVKGGWADQLLSRLVDLVMAVPSLIVALVMLNLAYLVVGVVVVEVVFGYNALGQYLVDHVTKRDLPVVQAVGLIFAAVYIFLNMLADVIGILANPRLRHPK